MNKRQINLQDGPKIYMISTGIFLVLGMLVNLILKNYGSLTIWVGYIIPQIVNIAVIIAYGKMTNLDLITSVPIKFKIKPVAVGLCLLLTVFIYMTNYFFAIEFSHLMTAMGVKMSVTVPDMTGVFNSLLAILVICIMPAIGEEMMFRGVFLSSMRVKGGTLAIILSSVVFSLMHANPAQIVHQFILAIILCYIVVKTNNIIYPMIIHFTNNILALFLVRLIPSLVWLDKVGFAQAGALLGISALGLTLFFIFIKIFMKVVLESPKVITAYPDGKISYFMGVIKIGLNNFKNLFKRGGIKVAIAENDLRLGILPVEPRQAQHWLTITLLFLAYMAIASLITSIM